MISLNELIKKFNKDNNIDVDNITYTIRTRQMKEHLISTNQTLFASDIMIEKHIITPNHFHMTESHVNTTKRWNYYILYKINGVYKYSKLSYIFLSDKVTKQIVVDHISYLEFLLAAIQKDMDFKTNRKINNTLRELFDYRMNIPCALSDHKDEKQIFRSLYIKGTIEDIKNGLRMDEDEVFKKDFIYFVYHYPEIVIHRNSKGNIRIFITGERGLTQYEKNISIEYFLEIATNKMVTDETLKTFKSDDKDLHYFLESPSEELIEEMKASLILNRM